MRNVFAASFGMLMFGCLFLALSPSAQSGSVPKDGELAFPSDYKSFPTFLKGVQKPNAVRDLYINKIGAEAHPGKPFAHGSIMVMEIYNAKKGTDGNFEKDADGHLIKAGLAKVYVMQKGKGWGNHAPDGLQNGDWFYSAFNPNGDRLDVEYAKCNLLKSGGHTQLTPPGREVKLACTLRLVIVLAKERRQ